MTTRTTTDLTELIRDTYWATETQRALFRLSRGGERGVAELTGEDAFACLQAGLELTDALAALYRVAGGGPRPDA